MYYVHKQSFTVTYDLVPYHDSLYIQYLLEFMNNPCLHTYDYSKDDVKLYGCQCRPVS